MIKRICNLTTGGLLVIVLGVVVAGLTIWFSSKNARFLEQGITREGRVISQHDPDSGSEHTLRVLANLSIDPDTVLARIVEVKVPARALEDSPVGSQIPLLILPGDPPSVRLKTKTEEASFGTGYLLALALLILGLLLLWLDRRKVRPRASRSPGPAEALRKVALQNTVLYDGAFEFSYAEEKNHITLANGSTLRINQYRPLAQLASALPEDDLLVILRTAKSEWRIPNDALGKEALAGLLKRREITGADQFFINGDHLGLLFRDEVDNGHWHSWVRGVWQLSPTARLLNDLLSQNPARAREAAEVVLYGEDSSMIASLTSHAGQIRKAVVGTPEDREVILLAADLLDALAQGTCPCRVYTASSHFAPDLLLARKRMAKAGVDQDEASQVAAHDLTCPLCEREFTVTAKVRAGVPLYQWHEKTH